MGKKQQKQQKSGQIFQVFISGIPYQCDENNLKQFLTTDSGIIQIKMPRYQDTGRCRGYAHIKFDNQTDYQNAIQKSGNDCEGRYLVVEPAKGQKQEPKKQPKVPVGCKVLFVKNLPYQISEKQIREEFKSCGIINDVRMVRNWANKQFKGFVYIDYRDLGSVKKAINKYHNKIFKGRKLICDGTATTMKKGYKKRDPNQYEQNDVQDQ